MKFMNLVLNFYMLKFTLKQSFFKSKVTDTRDGYYLLILI